MLCVYIYILLHLLWASVIAQSIKNPPAMQEAQFNSWVGKIHWRRGRLPTPVFLGFPCGSAGKESTCNVGDWVRSPGWEDSLEKGKVTPYSILAWRIPWTVRSMGLQRIGQDRATFIFTSQRTIHLLLGPVSHCTPSKHCPSASPQLTRISQTRAYAAAPRF